MTVKAILSVKGNAVVTARPDMSIGDLCKILAEKGIGAVLVTDGHGAILGIISERDIVRAMARGAGSLSDPVSAHMTTQVITVTEDATVVSLMSRMTSGRFRHLPVVRGSQLCGVISIGDVVKHRLAEMEQEREALKEYIGSA